MARDSDEVQAGPGLLYVAPIGTAEPTSATATLDSAFREVGYTESGPTFTYEVANDGIFVAEEFDPIRYQTTSRTGTLKFEMAQISIENLALALNQGANVSHSSTSIEPPEPGSEVRVMFVHQTEQGARWIFRQCINASSIELARKKAPDKGLIPVEFRLEKPTGLAPFKALPNADGLI